MSGFLVNEDNPDGYRLEDILSAIRKEIVQRANKIIDDRRTEATAVLNNNIKILSLLSESIEIAEDSTRLLDKSFGPHKSDFSLLSTSRYATGGGFQMLARSREQGKVSFGPFPTVPIINDRRQLPEVKLMSSARM